MRIFVFLTDFAVFAVLVFFAFALVAFDLPLVTFSISSSSSCVKSLGAGDFGGAGAAARGERGGEDAGRKGSVLCVT